MRLRHLGLLTAIAAAFLAAAGLRADPLGWSLRLAGGSAVTLDTFDETGSSNPTSAELLYSVAPRVQVGLGVFPGFDTGYSKATVVLGSTTYQTDTTVHAVGYPILANVYFRQPLGSVFELFLGFGLGWMPAGGYSVVSKYTTTPYVGDGSSTDDLVYEKALAFRGSLGVDAELMPHVRAGFQLQSLMVGGVNQSFYQVGGEDSFAPMFFLEGDL